MATDTETAPATEEAPAEPAAAEPAKKASKAKDAGKADEKAGKGDKKDKSNGDKKDKKSKKGKGEGEDEREESDAGGPSVAAHPRAARAVARAKGWGGLAGFVLGGYLSLPTNTVAAAGLRALIAGVVCYVAAWAGAVFLWRRLVMLEIKGREQQIIAARTANARRELPPGRPERQGAGAVS